MNDSALIRPPSKLARIQRRTSQLQFTMAGEERTGSLLRALAASKPGGRFLELGTGTGVSTAWLLDGMDGTAALTSVDVDPHLQTVAREELGDDPRVMFVLEDAVVFLNRHPPASFDLVFADVLPGKYDYLEAALAVVKPGGFYVIDDMLPQPNWPPGHAPRVEALLARLATLPEFRCVPLAWASGVVVVVHQPTRDISANGS